MSVEIRNLTICEPAYAMGYKEDFSYLESVILGYDNDCIQPEKRLWIAVLMQCLTDLKSNSKKKEFVLAKREADRWLFRDKVTFPIVANILGYTATSLRKNLIIFVESDRYQERF